MRLAIINLINHTPLSYGDIPSVNSNNDSMIMKFCSLLQEKHYDVDLYIADAYEPKEKKECDFNVYYLKSVLRLICLPSLIPCTPSLFKALLNKYDVILSSEAFQMSTVFAVIAKFFSRHKPKIIIWQEMAHHQRFFKKVPSVFFYKILLRLFLDKGVDLYVPRGTLAREFLITQGVSPEKVTHPIPHGVDTHCFYPQAGVKGKHYLFSPSRLVKAKGLDVLLRAFAIVHMQFNDLELHIQGRGPLHEECQLICQELGIQQKVFFCTERISHEDMRGKYQGALVTIFASENDLMIFSAMESLSCGTPVIVSTGVDIYHEFQHEDGGLVFPKGDFRALSSQIIRVLDDEEFYESLVRKAQNKASVFSNKHVVGEFGKLFDAI